MSVCVRELWVSAPVGPDVKVLALDSSASVATCPHVVLDASDVAFFLGFDQELFFLIFGGIILVWVTGLGCGLLVGIVRKMRTI